MDLHQLSSKMDDLIEFAFADRILDQEIKKGHDPLRAWLTLTSRQYHADMLRKTRALNLGKKLSATDAFEVQQALGIKNEGLHQNKALIKEAIRRRYGKEVP